jgi:hypothetical protein
VCVLVLVIRSHLYTFHASPRITLSLLHLMNTYIDENGSAIWYIEDHLDRGGQGSALTFFFFFLIIISYCNCIYYMYRAL